MATALNLEYPAILDLVRMSLVPGRTESHAFLVWFLQHYFRLDEIEAQDTVCDGPDDKGVDGIYLEDNLESRDRLQTCCSLASCQAHPRGSRDSEARAKVLVARARSCQCPITGTHRSQGCKDDHDLYPCA